MDTLKGKIGIFVLVWNGKVVFGLTFTPKQLLKFLLELILGEVAEELFFPD